MCPSVELFNSAKDTHAPRMNLCPAASDDEGPVTEFGNRVQAAKRRHLTGSKRAALRSGGIRPTRERQRTERAGRTAILEKTGGVGTSWTERLQARSATTHINPVPQGRHDGALRGIPVRRGDGKRRKAVAGRGRHSPRLFLTHKAGSRRYQHCKRLLGSAPKQTLEISILKVTHWLRLLNL